MPGNPEQQARANIDAMLETAGWQVQDYTRFNPSAARGIALREVPLVSGRCDYLLIIDRDAVGIIEAKKEGTTLSTVAEQSGRYGANLPDFLKSSDLLPFYYESTGIETFFRDERDPQPRSRRLFSFHRPETLAAFLEDAATLRMRLKAMPTVYPLVTKGFRDCQIEAITNLEKSFAADQPRSLIQMATGSGKTYTACAFTYRLIRYGGAKRVLFLVDRANLGRQAKGEFNQFVTPDTGRKFTELYNVQHLTSNKLDEVCRVTICTIQRLYSMLRGEELPEDADELSGWAISSALKSGSGVPPLFDKEYQSRDGSATLNVAYNPAVPIETFDFIVTDECHRSIYGLWRQVLEYFDAHLIGLTATPSKQTIGFFNQNLVMEYNHERAVAGGVNVGYEVYRIKTKVTGDGSTVEKGFYVDKRNKETRARRWERLDEDLAYEAAQLDRSVVVPSQIRTVLQAFKDALFTDLFPGRSMVPKTLIFAKDDSHAEDIVGIAREVFGKGNDFAKKITYQSINPDTGKSANAEQLIQQFRTSPQLRIAVTVDMIATGTDIKPLECLIFMRDVRSRTYFEQMKGRGTRVLTPTDLQAVSGTDAKAKTHFIIVDAVGVCESDKTDSRPLERQRTVAFDKLLLGVALGKRDEDTITTLAGRLARMDREIVPKDKQELKKLSGGKTLSDLSTNLLRALDPDEVEAESRRLAEDDSAPRIFTGTYFDPEAPVETITGDLPHWRQDGVMYFVTFRLADSLPQEKLVQWRQEKGQWLIAHPEPHDEPTRQEFYTLFPERMQHWLDAGHGSCVLSIIEVRTLVEDAFRHFDGQRYDLDEFVVAPNHVHVLVRPRAGFELSNILHSWKSFSAHKILKVDSAAHLLCKHSGSGVPPLSSDTTVSTTMSATTSATTKVWQKESFDHIVRSPASLEKFRQYIRDHREHRTAPVDWEKLRRDAAATLIAEACKPFDKPELRDALAKIKKEAEQIIDTVTIDEIVMKGFDAEAKKKAENIITTFREYIEEHRPEIEALQILYSRPYKQRLTEPMLKDLEEKLRAFHAAWTEDRLWDAFAVAAPAKVKGRSQPGRFADLVSLVRFSLEQQPVLEPFAESVNARFDKWLSAKKSSSGVPPLSSASNQSRDGSATFNGFTPDHITWLHLIRDHIATSLSIEPEDFDYAPFSQRGGLGKAHQLFGDQLPQLLEELNEVLAA